MQLKHARTPQIRSGISLSGHGQTVPALPVPKHMLNSLREFGKIQKADLSCSVLGLSNQWDADRWIPLSSIFGVVEKILAQHLEIVSESLIPAKKIQANVRHSITRQQALVCRAELFPVVLESSRNTPPEFPARKSLYPMLRSQDTLIALQSMFWKKSLPT